MKKINQADHQNVYPFIDLSPSPTTKIGSVLMRSFLLFSLTCGTLSFASPFEDAERGSYFGRAPSRFQSLDDEEGREVDFHMKEYAKSKDEEETTLSQNGRNPASAKPRLDDEAELKPMQRELSRNSDQYTSEESSIGDSSAATKSYSSLNNTSENNSENSNLSTPKKFSRHPSRSISSFKAESDGTRGAGIKDDGSSMAWAREDSKLKIPFSENEAAVKRRGVQEFSVIASDTGFYPKTFFVSRNIPVRLFVTGVSKKSSCIMMDSFNVRKQLKPNKVEEITFIPNQAGAYRFYCPVNNSDGMMVVKEINP